MQWAQDFEKKLQFFKFFLVKNATVVYNELKTEIFFLNTRPGVLKIYFGRQVHTNQNILQKIR